MTQGRHHGGTLGDLMDFSANINPLGPPSSVIAALELAMRDITRYPDPACTNLCEMAAAREKLPKSCIMFGNGAVELIFCALYSLRPKRAVIPVPSFCEYQIAAKASGAEIVLVESADYDIDIARLTNIMVEGDLILVCSPNNPTGRLISRASLEELIESAEAKGAALLIDEAFMDFVPDWHRLTLAGRASESRNVVVLRSLTKFYAIPGVRLGYAVSSPIHIDEMNAAKDPWSVNIFAHRAGVAALNESDYCVKTRQFIDEERTHMADRLSEIGGLRVIECAAANFLLIQLSSEFKSAGSLNKYLREEHRIAVRDCSSFDGLGPSFIRVAVKTRSENDKLISALTRYQVDGR